MEEDKEVLKLGEENKRILEKDEKLRHEEMKLKMKLGV